MQANKTLKKNMESAKKVVPNQQKENKDFPGEDGDYHFQWVKLREWEAKKDGALYCCFDLKCLDEGEVENYPMTILIGFTETAQMTIEDKQDQFFETLQLLGVETADLDPNDMEDAVQGVINAKYTYVCSVVTSKDKKYKNIRIKEILAEEWQGELEEAEEEEGTEDVEVEESGDTDSDANPYIDSLPSEWDGYQCNYGSIPGLWISNPDDDALTVDLSNDDDELVGEGVSWSEITPIDPD